MPSCKDVAAGVCGRFKKRKQVNIDDTSTSLNRCLSLKRLTFIGVGKTVGVGIYVLIGEATILAGPSVIIGFLISFVVVLLNGLCFAEFASKNPKTGAQYTYMYESVGEAVAFITGWTSIIGYTAALSMGSRGWSGYVDSLTDHAISNFTMSHVSNWTAVGSPLPEYPDLMAISIILFVVIINITGLRFASALNSVLTFIAAGLLVFISVVGMVYANLDNWFQQPGGFFPGGLNGLLKASASCFYAFLGFEVLGFSAEEATNPKKNIPRAIIISLVIVTVLYISVAVSFTLMVPYTAIDRNAPFPSAFAYNDVTWAKYVIGIGPILALTNLCVLEMYTIQRLSYSMATDGLLFRCFSVVNSQSKVPISPVIFFGTVTIILVLCIDLSNLIGFLTLYSFIQYSLFGAYLIILRYVHDEDRPKSESETLIDASSKSEKNDIVSKSESLQFVDKCCGSCSKFYINIMSKLVSRLSVTKLVLFLYVILFVTSIVISFRGERIAAGSIGDISVLGLLCCAVFIATLVIYQHEQKGDRRGFLVPCMPLLPIASVFTNLLMLVSIVEVGSLVASLVLAAIGAVIYLAMVIYDVVKTPMDTAMLKHTDSRIDDSTQLLSEPNLEDDEL